MIANFNGLAAPSVPDGSACLCFAACALGLVLVSCTINGGSAAVMIGENEALLIANEAVAQYGVSFEEMVQTSPAEASYVMAQVGVASEHADMSGQFVWSAEADVGERSYGGRIYKSSLKIYIDQQGKVLCKCCKLIGVIPGIVPVERVFQNE